MTASSCLNVATGLTAPPLATPVVVTTIRLRFDGHSTAYQRSSRSQWRNPPAAVTPTCSFSA